MGYDENEDVMFDILWRTLVQLKRVCLQLRLPAHAKDVGRLIDKLEDMKGDDDGTENDYAEELQKEEVNELARRADIPRGKPSRD